jgi:hypothetical protein
MDDYITRQQGMAYGVYWILMSATHDWAGNLALDVNTFIFGSGFMGDIYDVTIGSIPLYFLCR